MKSATSSCHPLYNELFLLDCGCRCSQETKFLSADLAKGTAVGNAMKNLTFLKKTVLIYMSDFRRDDSAILNFAIHPFI